MDQREVGCIKGIPVYMRGVEFEATVNGVKVVASSFGVMRTKIGEQMRFEPVDGIVEDRHAPGGVARVKIVGSSGNPPSYKIEMADGRVRSWNALFPIMHPSDESALRDYVAMVEREDERRKNFDANKAKSYANLRKHPRPDGREW